MINPVKIKPVFKDYLWGGEKLNLLYNKNSGSKITAESWELATHEEGSASVAEGIYKGLSLNEYIKKAGLNTLGQNANSAGELPLLTKFIDAKQSLSVQVHPDNTYAKKYENDNGKTEMWVILESEPDAFIYYGVNKNVTKEEIKNKISNGTVEDILRKVPAKKGDIFFIPPGTIHAIGEGLLVYEIQQSSNVTYRLYDFDRKDKSGNKRELHITKSLDVANLSPVALYKKNAAEIFHSGVANISLLHSCEHFSTFKYNVADKISFSSSEKAFMGLTVINGNGKLKFNNSSLSLRKGESIFIPAQEMKYNITGDIEFLLVVA